VLLNVVVLSTNATVQRGQTYVRIDIERGANARVTLGTLLAGYIDSSGGRAWPGSPLESGTEGPGWIHTIVFRQAIRALRSRRKRHSQPGGA
jgi:hypothetical protein